MDDLTETQHRHLRQMIYEMPQWAQDYLFGLIELVEAAKSEAGID